MLIIFYFYLDLQRSFFLTILLCSTHTFEKTTTTSVCVCVLLLLCLSNFTILICRIFTARARRTHGISTRDLFIAPDKPLLSARRARVTATLGALDAACVCVCVLHTASREYRIEGFIRQLVRQLIVVVRAPLTDEIIQNTYTKSILMGHHTDELIARRTFFFIYMRARNNVKYFLYI